MTKKTKSVKCLRFLTAPAPFFFLWILTIFVGACSGGRDSGNEGNRIDPVSYSLRVDRHINAELDNSRSDAILSAMQTILKVDDGERDVAGDVNFSRNGEIGVFNAGSGFINSEADFLAVNGLPGEIKVVNQINWCGGIAPDIIGCAPVPGNSFVVVRLDESREGILWLHEYGHNKGLTYRNAPDAVMNGIIDPTHKKVNQAECDAFRNAATLSPAQTRFPRYEILQDTMAIDDFVKQRFVRGVPYGEALKYSEKQVPGLLLMLSDAANINYWSNIVVTLGIIGDERALTPLMELIKADHEGVLSAELYTVKTSATMALGYLVNKKGNREALNFLKNSLNPHSWDESQPGWESPFRQGKAGRNIQLSCVAVLGLALSGHPEAVEALQGLKAPVETEEEKMLQNQISHTLDMAIDDCEAISREGLLQYYRERMMQ